MLKRPNLIKRITALGAITLSSIILDCSKTPTNNDNNQNNNPPNTYIDGIFTNGDLAHITGSGTDPDGDEIVGYEYWNDNTNPIRIENMEYFELTLHTSNGQHIFHLAAIDEHGKLDPTPASQAYTINVTQEDTTPPNTTITSGPSGIINQNSATFSWTGSDNQTDLGDLVYSYYLQGHDANYGSWISSTQKSYSNLEEDQTYTFRVRTKDESGNIDQTPAIRTFTVDAEQPTSNELTLQNQWQIPLEEGDYGLEGITIGESGNLITITGATTQNPNDEDLIIRMHNPSSPTSFLRYEVDIPNGNFTYGSGIAFDGNKYWAANPGYQGLISTLEMDNLENVLFTGTMDNLVGDICYGTYNSQPVMFITGDTAHSADFSIYSTEIPQSGTQFSLITAIDPPWDYCYGIHFSNGKIYTVSRNTGETSGKLYKRNPTSLASEKEWEFPQGTNTSSITGLAISGNNAYTTTGDNIIRKYTFTN